MCITFLINSQNKFKFVLLFNRDEFFNRPTLPIGFHNIDEKHKDYLLYPLDCNSQGTFLCINIRNGNFCALLNAASDYPYNPNPLMKRAEIPLEFCKLDLNDTCSISEFWDKLSENKINYNGFNILCGNMNHNTYYYYTNNTFSKNYDPLETSLPMKLNYEIFGLTNGFIIDDSIYNTKIEYGKKKIHDCLEYLNSNDDFMEETFVCELFKILEDRKKLIKEDEIDLSLLNDKEIFKNPKNKNYVISSLSVSSTLDKFHLEYGTRHSIILTLDYENNLKIYEQCDNVVTNSDQRLVLEERNPSTLNRHFFKLDF